MSSPILVAGVDRKSLPLTLRAQFSADAVRMVELLRASGVVALNTCERFELFGTPDNSRLAPVVCELHDRYGLTVRVDGDAALLRLFRVASGLESRLPGEPHVLGQVRAALNAATAAGPVTRSLTDAFTYAIRCGKRVRQRTLLGASASSYVEQVMTRLQSDPGLAGSEIAILGTGALAMELAEALNGAGVRRLTMIGRHAQRTAIAAQRNGAHAVTFGELKEAALRFDAVISAVSAAEPLVTPLTLSSFGSRLFVDLGTAPNIDPAIDALPGMIVLRLEHFGGAHPASFAIREAERVVANELARYLATRAAGNWGSNTSDTRKAS